ncbi:carcinine transporter isoform X2 [Arctopsyche grandis]|uniref:carcinine transporter isoform X2 n=1 Tax=Arctopsyche grandis TaxID=121162 RepID=UPI00406D9A83
MTDVPEHWCAVPYLINNTNMTAEQRKQISIPKDGDSNRGYDKCLRYRMNWTEMSLQDIIRSEPDPMWEKEKCLDGWEYDRSEVESSLVIDFDLVCDHAIYPTLGLVALNAGGPVGVYFFGFLNDKIGRKKSYFTCLSVLIIGSLLTSLAQNFTWWASSRVIVGSTIPAVYQIPFIISLELVGPNYRSFITVLTCMFYTLGLIFLSGIAYLVRDWRYLALVTSMPFCAYYFYWFFLPESPRWLLAKGRLGEALEILEKLARVNGKQLPESFKQKLKQLMMMKRTQSEEARLQQSYTAFSLCKTPNMRLKTFLITLNWFANEMVYVGLSYYGPSLGSNQYVSFFLASAVEIPSYIVCWIIMDKWGRRWPLCLSMVLSGVSCIITVSLPQDAVITTLVLFLFSKSLISASFLIIYPFAGELYPTQLRGVGIGTSAYIGGLGLIVIPFITYLGSENLAMPLVIMGSISVIGGISGLRLPETLHHKLPQTLEEGEEFGKDWSYVDCLRCIPIRPPAATDASYEDLDQLEMNQTFITDLRSENEEIPRRNSMRHLVRQMSVMDTQRVTDGTMKLTYWF